jgi:pSer/pThr/pTyr-binding forkhead associated (FHA) protein
MPKLQVSLPDGSETTHDLTEQVITVGRVSDNTLQIEDISVSSHHAELTLKGEDYVLRDLGSTNGTRLNGKDAVEEQDYPLQDGDIISFGKVPAVYASENPAEARPMPQETEVAAVAAEASVRPSDFANASPFQKRAKKKDPIAMGILSLAGLAILAFCGAVAMIFSIKSPL